MEAYNNVAWTDSNESHSDIGAQTDHATKAFTTQRRRLKQHFGPSCHHFG